MSDDEVRRLRERVAELEGLLADGRLWVVTAIQPTGNEDARTDFLRRRRSLLDRMDAALPPSEKEPAAPGKP